MKHWKIHILDGADSACGSWILCVSRVRYLSDVHCPSGAIIVKKWTSAVDPLPELSEHEKLD
jgi:hypothetical protein